ncbi:MAG: penicillin-binding transpeptidase domain-containing protein, partial [Acidimicrobiales bacterium]
SPPDPSLARDLDPAAAATLRTFMEAVVDRGTGTAAQVAGITVAGKTGTAEFGEGDPPPTHALFIGFDERFAVAVVVEGGGVGGHVAAPIAARFFGGMAG